MSQTWDKAGWQDAEGPGWLGRALSQPKGMGSTVGYRENKMRWGLQAVWMPALGLQGAEGRAGGHQQRRMPELCSVLCSWLFPVAKFYLQILAKHLAPLWHSKTSRFLSARLPAQSSLLLHQPGRSGGWGMSG